mgnify:CR=1 FL=1
MAIFFRFFEKVCGNFFDAYFFTVRAIIIIGFHFDEIDHALAVIPEAIGRLRTAPEAIA